jgi:hypothetical protein
MRNSDPLPAVLILTLLLLGWNPLEGATLRGRIIDQATGEAVGARLYVRSEKGEWFHVQSAAKDGVAVPYDKSRRETPAVEIHTTLSAHPFSVELAPGSYVLTVERGKEYRTLEQTMVIGAKPVQVELALERWINMAEQGWFSGETHVHRPLKDLPTLMLAEDLNVGLPLTAWIARLNETPAKNNRNREPVPPAKLIKVDDTHVIWPLNTEYEITYVERRRHHFGAMFVLNHRQTLELPAPPVIPLAKEARRQGALLDLDKHNWPWSAMLVPTMDVNLLELSNNHIWRTQFVLTNFFPDLVPDFMNIEKKGGHYTEWGWTEFGFKTFYAFLNCGFDIKPSAGCASGVHPVPLGFGRVYVQLENGFNYDDWMKGLAAGRSFVSTGPMLFARFNGQHPGHVFRPTTGGGFQLDIAARAHASHRIDRLEIIVNGDVVRSMPTGRLKARARRDGVIEAGYQVSIPLKESSWIAVRAFEDIGGGRFRFAHTAPVHVQIPGKPLRPKREEVEHFIARMDEELQRNQGILPEISLDEYRQARNRYLGLLKNAR